MKPFFMWAALAMLTLAIGPKSASAQTGEKAKAETPKLKTYYMVFLKKGPNQTHTTEEAKQIQAAHMAHIQKMAADKKLIIGGPFADDSEFRGIFIFDVATKEEAHALTAADPAVKAGRLTMELHPWLSEPGNCLK